MRIILLAAAVIGAAALGSAASARPGGPAPGQGGGQPGSWSSGDGHHGGKGVRTGFGSDAAKGDGGHGRRHGRFGRSGRDNFRPYGAAGISGPIEAADPYGNGFFNGEGGRIRLRGGRPHFDYDRGYPYEWASSDARSDRQDEAARPVERPARCNFENGVRVCRGW
jgi:hypothetical protein